MTHTISILASLLSLLFSLPSYGLWNELPPQARRSDVIFLDGLKIQLPSEDFQIVNSILSKYFEKANRLTLLWVLSPSRKFSPSERAKLTQLILNSPYLYSKDIGLALGLSIEQKNILNINQLIQDPRLWTTDQHLTNYPDIPPYLHLAAEHLEFDQFKIIAALPKTNVNQRSYRAFTPLRYAIKRILDLNGSDISAQLKIIKYLLSHSDFDPSWYNQRILVNGFFDLITFSPHATEVFELIAQSKHTDLLDIRGRNNQTLLVAAVLKGEARMAQLLSQFGVDSLFKPTGGRTGIFEMLTETFDLKPLKTLAKLNLNSSEQYRLNSVLIPLVNKAISEESQIERRVELEHVLELLRDKDQGEGVNTWQ